MRIIQGSNEPITLTGDPEMLNNSQVIRAVLLHGGSELKVWKTADVIRSTTSLVLPLSEAETLGFPCDGACELEVKFKGSDGIIRLAEPMTISIARRNDKHAIED